MRLALDILRKELSAFDGRAMTILGEIEARFREHADYLDHLVALSGDPEESVSNGATWLIKSAFESGSELSSVQTKRLISELTAVRDWAAQLHICQSARFLSLDPEDAQALALWLQPLLSHDRPFLRAWSVDALCYLSQQHPDFADMARQAHDAAHNDPAASVRARARNIQPH